MVLYTSFIGFLGLPSLIFFLNFISIFLSVWQNDNKNNKTIFVWPWKMVSVSVLYLFYQPMYKKIKTWPLRFHAKQNPNMAKALFDWPIVLQYDVKAKYWLISRKFSGVTFFHPERSLNQRKAASVCILG